MEVLEQLGSTALFGLALKSGLIVFIAIFATLGRTFGFFNPEHYRFLLILPWRPVWRIYNLFAMWRERTFSMGKRATAKWVGILGTFAMTYKPGHLLLGRALWHGLAWVQPIGQKIERHVVMVAGTGAGKTTMLQTILGLHYGPALVIDPKLQIEKTMGRARQRLGPVYTLAPFEHNSHSWNPLDEIDAAIARFGENVAPRFFLKLASATILKTPLEKPFFPNSARDIWAAIVAYVFITQTGSRRNLITAREFLMEGLTPEIFDNPLDAFAFLLSEMQCVTEYGGFIRKRAISLQNTGAEALGNVLATARTETQWLDLPEVRKVLCHSDLLLADLKRNDAPITLFLGAPVTAIQGELSRWFRLVVELSLYLFELIPGNLKEPCLFALDEMPSLRRIEAVETAAPLLRSFGVRLIAIGQDTEKFKQAYPQAWEGFIGNADVVYWMGTNHQSSLKYLEGVLGQTTYREKVSGGWFSKEPKRFQLKERPLLYAEQIKRFLDPDSANMIITRFGKRPVKVKQAPFHKELPVWSYDVDPNYTEQPARAWFRSILIKLNFLPQPAETSDTTLSVQNARDLFGLPGTYSATDLNERVQHLQGRFSSDLISEAYTLLRENLL